MTSTLQATEVQKWADQHPRYSALCTLPDGTHLTTAAAKAQGIYIRDVEQALKNFEAPPQPLPAATPVPTRPIAPPVPEAVRADRARALTLMAMTAKSAEAQRECQAAIRSGMTVEQYAATVAARFILEAVRASRGHGRR